MPPPLVRSFASTAPRTRGDVGLSAVPGYRKDALEETRGAREGEGPGASVPATHVTERPRAHHAGAVQAPSSGVVWRLHFIRGMDEIVGRGRSVQPLAPPRYPGRWGGPKSLPVGSAVRPPARLPSGAGEGVCSECPDSFTSDHVADSKGFSCSVPESVGRPNLHFLL